ncbi:DUF1016 N-terminal domain-containing protein [Endozoicomonas lisbonensis]|uniref:YhcG N-terminal domain-containing protein n=1 Tax=Endozoicomonas lisbonensis TaxID=3120522 RepID=A0ABV2SNQ1_9GAMM
MSKKNKPSANTASALPSDEQQLVSDIRTLIDSARQRAAVAVNAELTLLYLHVGQRINEAVLANERAEYGKQIVATLAHQLTQTYGRGWSETLLRYCLRAAQVFPDSEIQHTLCAECTGKNQQHIELMELDKSNIRVADYLTSLPPKEVLEAKLKQSIEAARQHLEYREEE